MRVLVTRAEPDAGLTARKLEALGHLAIVAPLAEVERLPFTPPDDDVDLVIATSARALEGLAELELPGTPPFAVVGSRAAARITAAGFSLACPPATDASALAARLTSMFVEPRRILYLAGRPRKPQLEAVLAAAGHALMVRDVYAMHAVQTLPERVVAAWQAGQVDAVLHYSHESAARFWRSAGHLPGRCLHLCLSPDVAAALPGVDPAQIRIAERPDEAALIALLELPR